MVSITTWLHRCRLPLGRNLPYTLAYGVALGLALQSAFPGLGWAGNLVVSLSGCLVALLCWQASWQPATEMMPAAAPGARMVMLSWAAGIVTAAFASALVDGHHTLTLPPESGGTLAHRLVSYAAMTLPAILPFLWGRQAEELLRRHMTTQMEADRALKLLLTTELAVVAATASPETLTRSLMEADDSLARQEPRKAKQLLEQVAEGARSRLSRLNRAIPPDMPGPAPKEPLYDNPMYRLHIQFSPGIIFIAWELVLIAVGFVESFILNQPVIHVMAFVHIVGWMIAAGTIATAHHLHEPLDAGRPIVGGLVFGNVVGKAIAGLMIAGSPVFMFTSAEGLAVMPFSLFFGLTGGAILWKYGARRRAQVAVAKSEFRKQQAIRLLSDVRLKVLKAQIEPHFLFNTLSNIVAQIELCPLAARRMIALLIRILHRTNATNVAETLGEELVAIREYLELQELRIGPRLSWSVTCPDELLGEAFPLFLIQPIVENAIRHGIEAVAGNHLITVEVTADTISGRLSIEVTDTGRGLTGRPSSGVGLRNIRERLAALYGKAGRMDVRANVPNGLRVTLHLPMNRPPADDATP